MRLRRTAFGVVFGEPRARWLRGSALNSFKTGSKILIDSNFDPQYHWILFPAYKLFSDIEAHTDRGRFGIWVEVRSFVAGYRMNKHVAGIIIVAVVSCALLLRFFSVRLNTEGTFWSAAPAPSVGMGPAMCHNIPVISPNAETVVLTDSRLRPVRPPLPLPPSSPRRAVAVSLLAYKNWRLMHTMLESLFASDLTAHDVTLVVWLNDPSDASEATFFLQRLLPPWRLILLHSTDKLNKLILMPRLHIWETVKGLQQAGCHFDYMLEIHDDMMFPAQWFNPLLTVETKYPCVGTKGCGIIMPFIINPGWSGEVAAWTIADIEAKAASYRKDKVPSPLPHSPTPAISPTCLLSCPQVLTRCIQVHPWMLNLSAVAEVGYYDKAYAPVEVEDDDFYFRMNAAGYQFAAVQSSVVFHPGAATRGGTMYLASIPSHLSQTSSVENLKARFAIFEKKHGMSVEDFKAKKLNKCHPAIYYSYIGWDQNKEYV